MKWLALTLQQAYMGEKGRPCTVNAAQICFMWEGNDGTWLRMGSLEESDVLVKESMREILRQITDN